MLEIAALTMRVREAREFADARGVTENGVPFALESPGWCAAWASSAAEPSDTVNSANAFALAESSAVTRIATYPPPGKLTGISREPASAAEVHAQTQRQEWLGKSRHAVPPAPGYSGSRVVTRGGSLFRSRTGCSCR